MTTTEVSMLELLTNQVKNRSFQDDELRSMAPSYRNYIARKNGSAVAEPPGFSLFSRGREIFPADKNAAVRIISQSKAPNTSSYREAAYANTAGGTPHYTPEHASFMSLNGTTVTRANAVIPANYDVPEKRGNVQAVAALVSQFVVVKKAVWIPNVPLNTWHKVLPRDGGMEAADFATFAETSCLVLNSCQGWLAKDNIGKNSCTGLEALTFIRNQLDLIGEDEYNFINTRLVYSLLRPFVKDGTSWFTRIAGEDGEETPVIPEFSYKAIDASTTLKKLLKAEGYPRAYWYLGGYAPRLNLPANTGRWKETLERYQKMMELQVGNESCTAILSGMRGYSGLTDEFGKRMQFTVSVTLSALLLQRDVDIHLHTVGDIVMLENSINKFKKLFSEKPTTTTTTTVIPVGTTTDINTTSTTTVTVPPIQLANYSVNYILPSPTDLSKIPHLLVPLCINTPRDGSVLVVWNANSLPTSSEKNVAVDYVMSAQNLIPKLWRSNDFIMLMPIYDGAFFPEKNTADILLTSNKSRKIEAFTDKLGPFVYSFGTAANFRGIVSTIPSLSLTGYGYPLVDKKWDCKVPEGRVSLSLPLVESYESWLKKVSIDCATQMLTFLFPISRYSPISNLLYMSRKGVTLVMDAIQQEDGSIIPNFAVRPIKIKRGAEILAPGETSLPPLSPAALPSQAPSYAEKPQMKRKKGKEIAADSSEEAENDQDAHDYDDSAEEEDVEQA